MGLLAQNGANFGTVAAKQTISLAIGIVAFIVFSRIHYTKWRKYAFFIFIGAIGINLLLFIPGISLYYGGASRWINIGPLTFQPSEFLKIAFIIYVAAWIQHFKDKMASMKHGLIPYAVIMAILSALLLSQSDTDTLVIIGFAGIIMFFMAGMPLKHIALSMIMMGLIIFGVIMIRPYAYQRVMTFLNHANDTQGAGYQINQSLIAIGSGQLSGRGFGQSIQKFGYLPEPIGDSIFAVASEEFGFIGSIALIIVYILVVLSSFRIASRAADTFGGFLTLGIAILIITESFMNIAAMLGLIPLSGVPLLFISHGGTALIIALSAAGIVANVSRYKK